MAQTITYSTVNVNIFLGGLTFLFILGKVFKITKMSWWWVFSPLWIPPVVIVAFIVLVFLVVALAALLKG